MDRLPAEEEAIAAVADAAGEGYAERLDSERHLYKVYGWLASTLYLHGGGWRSPGTVRDAYRLGGLLGTNARVVDDVLDGDGCEPVDDRERFLDRYVDAVAAGVVHEPRETPVERGAYTAARMLHDALDREDTLDRVTDRLGTLRDLVAVEDKSTPAGYRRYARAAGAGNGSVVGEALDVFPDYDVREETVAFGRDIGLAAQVADDRFDGDTGLPEPDLDAFYREAVDRLSSHGVPGRFLAAAADHYPRLIGIGNTILRREPGGD